MLQVYIAQLQWWVTDEEIEAQCSAFGTVTGLKFIEDRTNGKSKGVVLVQFSDPESAARCKDQLHG
jgi:RNA recognition motif-containing protein